MIVVGGFGIILEVYEGESQSQSQGQLISHVRLTILHETMMKV
jgi:hypothetical protein